MKCLKLLRENQYFHQTPFSPTPNHSRCTLRMDWQTNATQSRRRPLDSNSLTRKVPWTLVHQKFSGWKSPDGSGKPAY